jgi:hypothetical protein
MFHESHQGALFPPPINYGAGLLKPGMTKWIRLMSSWMMTGKCHSSKEKKKPKLELKILVFELWLLYPVMREELSSQSFFELLRDFRNDGKKITHDTVGGYLKNRGLGIFIDGDDDVRCLHSSQMLYRP